MEPGRIFYFQVNIVQSLQKPRFDKKRFSIFSLKNAKTIKKGQLLDFWHTKS
jgi:hypothetical protein